MAVYGYTKNYKLIKPQFDTDTWHDYEYDNLDTIDAVLSAIFASGDWQGFWKTNTHYDAGGVVIDRATDTMYKIMVEHTTSEATFAAEFAAHPTYYELWSPNQLAEDWAIKMDGVVSNTDYSSKAYAISSALIDAGSAKEWAVKTGGTIGTTGEYSAKKHAQDSASSASTATSQASAASASATLSSQWAVSPTLVASTDYSSKSWATGSLDAGSAKDWAIKEGGQVGTTGKYSAKVYSLAAENHYEKARDWASKTNGQVESTDYSAKAYAISVGLIPDGSAKEWSNKAKAWATSSTIIEDGKYGASYYALQAYNANVSAQNNKTLSKDWATKMDGQVASTDYSSKYYAGQAAASSNNANIWAEGTDAQVQALGGTHSSKVWAEQSTNANIALTNSPYTTNRILEIPQNIKLELSSGTLTLKAGSKVYVPNGFETDGTTPKFDVVTIGSDITHSFSGGTKRIGLVNNLQTFIAMPQPEYIVSGPTDTGSGTHFWYDTTNNLIKMYDNGTYTSGFSLPVGLFSVSGSSVTAIDQVFNGFGYIGSTVFVLPGVKVQAPNGKNEDGTYKSNILTVDNVETVTFTSADSPKGQPLIIRPYTAPCLFYANWHFDETTGYIVTDSGVISNAGGICVAGSLSADAGKITRLVAPNVDSVANSNASNFSQVGRSYLSGLGNPSTQNINLVTTGAINTNVTATAQTYIAPANGVVQIVGLDNNYILLTSNNLTNRCGSGVGAVIYARVEVSKGETVHIKTDSGTASLIGAKFIYANGEV